MLTFPPPKLSRACSITIVSFDSRKETKTSKRTQFNHSQNTNELKKFVFHSIISKEDRMKR